MNRKVLKIVIIAFMAAVVAATGFFRIPLPGLTGGIVLQNALCIMTAVLLGGILGAAPTALFFTAGILGLPIFSGWHGGFSVLTNINGGFRIGWVLGALVAGLISGKSSVDEKQISVKYAVRITVAVFAGMLALYIPEIFYVMGFRSHSAYFNEYTVQTLGLSSDLIGQLAKYTPELIEKFNLDASLTDQVISFTPEVIQRLGLDPVQAGIMGSSGAFKMFLTMYFLPFLAADAVKAVIVVLISLKLRPVVAQYVYE